MSFTMRRRAYVLLSACFLGFSTVACSRASQENAEFQAGVSSMGAREWEKAIVHFGKVPESHSKYKRARELEAEARGHKENESKLAAETERKRAAFEAARIPYRVIDVWAIPNGGNGRAIVIDPKFRNSLGMRALGETLKEDTKNDRNAFVAIYDAERAAKMHRKRPSEGTKDERYFGQHTIGSYIRNINTGHHVLNMMLSGVQGSSTEVKY